LPRAIRAAGEALHMALDREQGRWFLWLPVFFGLGIALYFGMEREPPGVWAAAMLALAAVLRVFLRSTLSALLASSALFAFAAGFAAAKVRTWSVAAPVLERPGGHDITGIIESVERKSAKRSRIVLRVLSLTRDDRTVERTPYRARISINGEATLIPGSAVKFRAMLFRPPEPILPGGYDFGRTLYFQGVGASGYSLSKPEPAEGIAVPATLRARAALARLRLDLAERIQQVLPGQVGAIAAALTVGTRADLNEATLNDMRASGLAHVLSISGLHMTLVAGTLYWLIRWALALVPVLALRFPIRAWAAAAALAFATLYLALSGAAIATQRSYLMVAVIFLAVMLNRPAISLRNIACAALLILALMPESLLDASFQMSFAATAALVAGYETFGRRLNYNARGVWDRLLMLPVLFAAGTLFTTLLASTATAPFSAYHFHNGATYAPLGNLLGMPAVSLIVMPAAVLSLVAMPFGLEALPLQIMGFGIEIMMWIAAWVASLDGALVTVPTFSAAALALMVFGGLWLIIWRRPWRLAGIGAIAAGLAIAPGHSKPDILIEREGKIIAVRGADEQLHAPKTRKGSYALAQWLKADGDSRKPKDAASGRGFQCDLTACLASVNGHLISHVLQPDAFAQDCERARIVITELEAPDTCRKPALIIDKWTLWQAGAHALSLAGETIAITTAAGLRGDRPWAPPRHRRERIDPALSPGVEDDAPVAAHE
jgi:competence protein ComEC